MLDLDRNSDAELTVRIFNLEEKATERMNRISWYDTLDAMMKCPVVRFCYFFITLPIRRARLYYEHKSPEIQRFVHDNLIAIRRNLTQDILYGLQYGFIPFEKRFRQSEGLVFYREFLPVHPRLTVVKTKNGSFDGFRVLKSAEGFDFLRESKEKEEIDVPAWKSFIFTNEFAFRNYYGKSFLTAAYVPWLLWKETVRLHGHAMADFVLPAVIARGPEGQGSFNIDGQVKQMRHAEYLMRVVQAIRSRSSVFLPAGDYSIDLLQLARPWDFAKDYEVWEQLIALSLLVPRDLFKPGGGSYAKAREQSFWFAQTANSILQQIVDFVYAFVIVPLVSMNFISSKYTTRSDFGELFFESISARDAEFLQSVAKKFLETSQRPDWTEILRILHVPQRTETQPQPELPLTKSALEKSLRSVLVSAFDQTKKSFGVDGVKVPQKAFSSLKQITKETMALLEENTNRRKVIAEAIERAQSVGRMAAFSVIKSVFEGAGEDEGTL